jgi:hypothetical protein
MSFDLKIVFQGMCTFVPERDGSGLWVLMVDATVDNEPGVPPHETVIRFPLDNLVPGSPGTGFRKLSNHDVRISPEGDTPLQLKGFDAKENKPVPAVPSADSFFWLAPAEEPCENRGLPDRALIDPRFLMAPIRIAPKDVLTLGARFFFSKGSVGTHELAGINAQVVESVFKPPEAASQDTDYRQRTAATVVLETVINFDSVTFVTNDLRTGEASRPLTLVPSDFGGKKSLTVFVMNEEAESIVGLAPPPKITLGQVRTQDKIFRSMYRLCSNPPATDAQPMPVPERLIPLASDLVRGIILDGAPPCSPNRGVLPKPPTG